MRGHLINPAPTRVFLGNFFLQAAGFNVTKFTIFAPEQGVVDKNFRAFKTILFEDIAIKKFGWPD